jgi:hypothetical protein
VASADKRGYDSKALSSYALLVVLVLLLATRTLPSEPKPLPVRLVTIASIKKRADEEEDESETTIRSKLVRVCHLYSRWQTGRLLGFRIP